MPFNPNCSEKLLVSKVCLSFCLFYLLSFFCCLPIFCIVTELRFVNHSDAYVVYMLAEKPATWEDLKEYMAAFFECIFKNKRKE